LLDKKKGKKHAMLEGCFWFIIFSFMQTTTYINIFMNHHYSPKRDQTRKDDE
jgi:hypothetical protein